jgi:signal peptidase II
VRPQYVLAGSLAAIIVLLDQFAKMLIQKHLLLWTSREIIPGFFNLTHTVNRGAAFGFLNRADSSWQTYFFIAATALAIMIILNLLSKAAPTDKILIVALGLILGGALGNLVDRMRLGEVVDFLDFAVAGYHWPAFNVADIAISLGSLALIVSLYTQGRRRQDRRKS